MKLTEVERPQSLNILPPDRCMVVFSGLDLLFANLSQDESWTLVPITRPVSQRAKNWMRNGFARQTQIESPRGLCPFVLSFYFVSVCFLSSFSRNSLDSCFIRIWKQSDQAALWRKTGQVFSSYRQLQIAISSYFLLRCVPKANDLQGRKVRVWKSFSYIFARVSFKKCVQCAYTSMFIKCNFCGWR